MRVLVEVRRTGERKWLRANEKITIGRSPTAQVEINDPQMAAEHFKISVEPDGCWLECLTDQQVQVNGVAASQHELQDQDLVVAGESEFAITIEGQSTATEAENTAPPYQYSKFHLPTGCLLFQSSDPLDQPTILTSDLADSRQIFVLANYTAAGIKKPESLADGSDLFHSAPEEIRDEHSLFLLAAKNADSAWQDYEPLRGSDAALIGFCTKSKEEVLKDLKFHFAWFSKPSILKFQMQDGTKQLVQQLLNVFDCVFAEDKDRSWWVAASENKCEDFQQVGFRHPPSNNEK